ncbi:splicing factor 3B subunit 4, partial [Nannochloropsis gaditana CCMP526]
MASGAIEQRNQDATVYCGGLDEKVTEDLLWELMQNVGPVVHVHMPRDKVTGMHQCFGFVEFRSEEDADYAVKIMNMVRMYGKPLRVNKASQDRKTVDVGANLFIGNLAAEVDEKDLYDTFSAFGGITQPPKVMFDPDTGHTKGFGFVSFDSFEAADYAIECMNGAYLGGRPICVQYAYKKDSKGERHGSQAERLLAASNQQAVRFKAHTLFATGPGQIGTGMGAPPPPPSNTGAGQPQHQQQQYFPPPPPFGMQGSIPPPPPPPPPGYGHHQQYYAPPPPPPPPPAMGMYQPQQYGNAGPP